MKQILFPLFALCLYATASHAATDGKPNILVILTDDQGYGDIGVHGLDTVATPHMDSLAREGVRCTQAYANPICGPSRAALMTGMFPARFGNDFNPGREEHAGSYYTGLRPEIHNLGERLQDSGYHTGWIGKWHLGCGDNPVFHPVNQGFHEWFDYEKGRKKLPPFPVDRNGEVTTSDIHATPAMAKDGAGFIEAHRDTPWFLYYAPHTLHTVIAATDEYREKVPDAINDPKRREYLASLLMEDDGVGQLLSALEATSQKENTLVFFLSDNGGASETGAVNLPFRGHKSSTLEGGIRVPFFVRWPAQLPAGTTYDQPVSEMDILPTALAAAGSPLPQPEAADGNPGTTDQIDGVDILPYLKGQNPGLSPHSTLFWRFGDQVAIRKGPWKLLTSRETENADGKRLVTYHKLTPEKHPFLVNLDDDPYETTNVASEHPDIVRELAREWESLNYDMAEPAFAYTGESRFHREVEEETQAKNDDAQDDSQQKPSAQSAAKPTHPASKKPNVLFLIVDDMNWRIGCYGNELAHTPNLDRLAEHGVRFDRAYCNYPVCGASRTSFLSGRYPSTTGVLNNGVDPRLVLGENYRFLPEYFRDHGYFTVGVGKIPHTPENIDSMKWDFHRDPQWQPEDIFANVEAIKDTAAWPAEKHPDGISARLALKYLREKRDQPLFLTVGFHRPHAPRGAPQQYWDEIDPDIIPIPEPGVLTEGIPAIAYPPKFEPDYAEPKIRSTLEGYYATSAFVDDQVGMLLDALDEEEMWDDTIVVFFSDHGVHLGEHGGFWSKMSLMEEALKVPLLVHMPGGPSGAASAEPVELIDIFPTLTELCGLPPQEGVEGESLVPLLKDPSSEREKSGVYSIVLRDGKDNPLGYSIRTKRWAYSSWPDGSTQLYDHLNDPGEMINLSGHPEHRQIEERLANKVEKFQNAHPLQTAPAEPQAAEEKPAPVEIPPIYRKGAGFEPDEVVAFKKVGDRELKLDVFYPDDWTASDKRPAALFFFGGGWKNGDTLQFYPQAEYLTTRGMVAICAEYRTKTEDDADPPDCVEDAKSAVRYVRGHAGRFGIDPEKLAVGGGSAGGHLAAATATIEAYDSPGDDLTISPVPNALLLYNPACDNSAEGYGFDRVGEYWETISPMEHLDGEVPPTIIFLGDQDGVFPVPRARLYQERMQKGGNRCELLIYPDQVHGFFRLDRKKKGFNPEQNQKYFLETTEELDRFLESLGYVSGDPTVRDWFSGYTTAKRGDKPNVIVILADDLGYADVGAHGSSEALTPHIDSLAANGIRFTNAYASAPVCSPSRAGLLTGKYQNRFGFEFLVNDDSIVQPDKFVGLDPAETTFADRMKELGYVTGCIGKWHLGSEEPLYPTNRGFDEFYGTLGQSGYYEPVLYDSRTGMQGKKVKTPDYYTTDDYSRRAVEFVRQHQDAPFFLYLAHFAVHKPYDATETYLSRFPESDNPIRHAYLAMLSAMDDGVGQLLATLRETGIEDDTLIFFLSDNGGTQAGVNEPLTGKKGSTWEGGIRTPLFVQWKKQFAGGQTYEKPVISLDILPTSIAAAGGKVSDSWNLDGVNLLPYLQGESEGTPHDVLYWRFGTQWAIRAGDWKLTQTREASGGNIQIAKTGPPRLFQLADDPTEGSDLAPASPEKVVELRKAWETWAQTLPKPHWEPKPLD